MEERKKILQRLTNERRCRYFADGNCHYGDKCKYSHTYPQTSYTPNTLSEFPSYPAVQKNTKRCRNIELHGICRTQGCEFNHDPIDLSTEKQFYQREMPVQGSVSQTYLYQDEVSERRTDAFYDSHYNSEYYGNTRNFSNEAGYSPYRSGMNSNYNYTPMGKQSLPMEPVSGSPWDAPRIAVTAGGTTYFYPTEKSQSSSQENQNRYIPSLPHVASAAGQRSLRSFFINEDLRNEFHKRAIESLAVLDHKDPRAVRLPALVGQYHSLYPLDKIDNDKSVNVFGHISHLFKCINTKDRLPYLMRRIDGFHLEDETALKIIKLWRDVQHPTIVNLREIFTTTEFSDNSLIFIYDYHPKAVTLAEEHFTRSKLPVSEDTLWSYIVQIISALRVIHKAKLACRVIHPTKIILTGKNRIRICGIGVLEVINFDGDRNEYTDFQQEDLFDFGQLLLCIGNRNGNACDNMETSMQHLREKYSEEIVGLITDLISMKITSVDQIDSSTFIDHVYKDNMHLQNYADYLESEVSKELESGRLFRLIAKLGFINERPEYQRNPQWGESGDKHMLALFRDYVFHQVYESGLPRVDLAHVIDTLNKLDAGSLEKIVLVSRNETTVMTVSYQDIKNCLDNAFKELQMTKVPYQGYN